MTTDLNRKIISLIVVVFVALVPFEALAIKAIDYQRRLNPRFPKRLRSETRFIILHSTESRLPSALRTLSRGKARRGRLFTHGGHAHYLVARSGTIYRILDRKYWANHAGVSMWNGLEDLSDRSIGIELEGYHNVPFADRQYESLKKLLKELQERYDIADRDVIEHYRIAYADPNRYHRSKQRGRKLDPGIDNFDRTKAGLMDEYPADPDVIAGRINGSPDLMRAGGQEPPEVEAEDEEPAEEPGDLPSNQISRRRTAWQIAGIQYNAPTTVYRFPTGRSVPGDQISDWSDLPAGTQVEMGVAMEPEHKIVTSSRAEVVLPEITAANSPWRIANALYNSSITFYLFPDGRIQSGNRIANLAALPRGTKVLVAYRQIPSPRTLNALGEDLDDVYLAPRTLYLLPGQTFRSGEQIEDFTQLPPNTQVFCKVE